MTERAGDDFGRGENDVGRHPKQGDASAGLQIAGRSVRVRMHGHRMSGSIKAIVYQAHGKPEEVLRLEEQSLPAVAADEALVRVLAAPINPADLNQIEGKYPIRPPLPATPGFEGAGVVEKTGAAVREPRGRNAGHSAAQTRHMARSGGREGGQTGGSAGGNCSGAGGDVEDQSADGLANVA